MKDKNTESLNQKFSLDAVKSRDHLIDRINSVSLKEIKKSESRSKKQDRSVMKTETYEPYLINYDYHLDKNLLLQKGLRNSSL